MASPGALPALTRPRRRWSSLETLAAAAALLIALRPLVTGFFDRPALQTWTTVFVSLVVQALPFLVLGVAVSGGIAAFVPASVLSRVLPRRPGAAVPAAGVAGVLLPGCECGSVPIAGRLAAGGVALPAALAFMLSAPAINPVVMVATAVAFPGRPEMVAARFAASLVTAIVMGWMWARWGRAAWTTPRLRTPAGEGISRLSAFAATARSDFGHAGGFLVAGAATAATLQVVVPRSVTDVLGGSGLAAVLVLGILAVVLSVCSEADAFVAASLASFSPTARLAFMVVGPAVDVKLVALQTGTFGRAFALRFAPLTFVVAIVSASLAGWWLL